MRKRKTYSRPGFPSFSSGVTDYGIPVPIILPLKKAIFRRRFLFYLRHTYWPWIFEYRVCSGWADKAFRSFARLGMWWLAKRVFLATAFKLGWVIVYDYDVQSQPGDRSLAPHRTGSREVRASFEKRSTWRAYR